MSNQSTDIYNKYETGIEGLINRVGVNHDKYNEILVYQQRLAENIDRARKFGKNDTNKSERFEITDRINVLTLNILGITFKELCDNSAILTDNKTGQSRARIERIVKNNLPQPWYGKFIGREQELIEIKNLLLPYPRSQYHIIEVDGVGGVGKTVLAVETAYHYVRDSDELDPSVRFDAVIYVSAKRNMLTSTGIVKKAQSLRNLEDIFNVIAQVFNYAEIRTSNSDDQIAIVKNILSENRCLLIVDNLETVEDSKVMEFIRDLPAPTKAIVTSRHRSVEGAIPFRVKGMRSEDGLNLIKEECKRKQVLLSTSDCEYLAKHTEGVPLAIIWSIGRFSLGHSVEKTLLRLQSANKDYAQFVFNDSMEYLRESNNTNALSLLIGLALFPDGATRDALGFVSGLQSLEDVRDENLAILLSLSLINNESGRFTMLSLTREYANALLAQDREFKQSATDRWFEWHVSLTEQAGGGKLDLDASILEVFDTEHTNILWAVNSSFSHERFDVFNKLLKGMAFYWMGRGFWNDYDHYFELGRLLAPKPEDRIYFATRLIWLNILRQNFDRSVEMLNYAKNLEKDHPNDYERMRIEDYSGQLYMELDDLDDAEDHLWKSINLARSVGDRRGQFAGLKYLGELYCRRGDSKKANDLLKQAEPLAAGTAEDKWVRGLAHASQLRGMISMVNGEWDQALTGFQSCIDYLNIWPDERLYTKVITGMAFSKFQIGLEDEANLLLLENEGLYKKLGMNIKRSNEIISVWKKDNISTFWPTL